MLKLLRALHIAAAILTILHAKPRIDRQTLQPSLNDKLSTFG